jgi:hypothetical protein
MPIRPFQPGDEAAQARVYNTAAAPLPGFKPATAAEIERRFRAVDADPASTLYAIEDGGIVGYAVFNSNGRVSYPWCLPGAEGVREPLLRAGLAALRARGCPEAWIAYRADWGPVLEFFREHRFAQVREMVNFVARIEQLPRAPLPEGCMVAPLRRDEVSRLRELGQGVFPEEEGADSTLESFFWENPYVDPGSVFALRETAAGTIRGAAMTIVNPGYADPTQVDSAMPCFRLGAFGTEHQRHKRVNGLFACVFAEERVAEALLAEAARRLERAGLTHIAAQAPSDQPVLCRFYGRFFQRQGSFPILVRRLADSSA